MRNPGVTYEGILSLDRARGRVAVVAVDEALVIARDTMRVVETRGRGDGD